MGLLNIFSGEASKPKSLPSGSFTIDPYGRIIASTLPRSVPDTLVLQIGRIVLATFRTAQSAGLHFSEISVDYPALRLKARELRGGAMVFLSPNSSRPKS